VNAVVEGDAAPLPGADATGTDFSCLSGESGAAATTGLTPAVSDATKQTAKTILAVKRDLRVTHPCENARTLLPLRAIRSA
jgi:hypothetical protein